MPNTDEPVASKVHIHTRPQTRQEKMDTPRVILPWNFIYSAQPRSMFTTRKALTDMLKSEFQRILIELGGIPMIRTINGPDLANPRLRTLAENNLHVINNRFPVLLVKARSVGKDEGQRLGIAEIGRIWFPIALDGRHQGIGRTRVKDIRLGIKSGTHGGPVGTESDKSMFKREQRALTKVTRGNKNPGPSPYLQSTLTRPHRFPDATDSGTTQLVAYPRPDITYLLQINRVSR